MFALVLDAYGVELEVEYRKADVWPYSMKKPGRKSGLGTKYEAIGLLEKLVGLSMRREIRSKWPKMIDGYG